MKFNLKKEIPLILISLLPLIYLIIAWSKIPLNVPIHFNAEGIADTFASRIIFGASIVGLLVFGYLVGFITEWFDNRKPSKQMGEKFLNKFKLFVVLEMAACASLFIYVSTSPNPKSDLALLIPCFLLILIGNIFQTIQKDSFIGYNVSWARHSEAIWNKTHRFAGRLCILAGILFGIMYFVTSIKNTMTIGWVIMGIAFVTPYIYSYFLYKKEIAIN